MKDKCTECYNKDNETRKAEFFVRNHPFYFHDVKICRHHLAIMFDWFTHGSDTKEITIIRLEKE